MDICEIPEGYVEDSSDCDDSNVSLMLPITWYADSDGDGYGDAAITEVACEKPDYFVDNDDDCNDQDATVYSGNNDEAGVLCVLDEDGDGYGAMDAPLPYDQGTDCEDSDGTIFPGASETVDDGIDSNCNDNDND